jgi:hypothetical protein
MVSIVERPPLVRGDSSLQSALDPLFPNVKGLNSTGGPIAPECIGSLQPLAKDAPLEELRKFYQENGYLWVKGLLPAEDVWTCRQKYFEYFAGAGLLKEGTPPREGIYCGGDWRMVCDNVPPPVHIPPNYTGPVDCARQASPQVWNGTR